MKRKERRIEIREDGGGKWDAKKRSGRVSLKIFDKFNVEKRKVIFRGMNSDENNDFWRLEQLSDSANSPICTILSLVVLTRMFRPTYN